MKKENKYVSIDGIDYEIKNPDKKNVVEYYQHNLIIEIGNYISKNIMTDNKKTYVNALRANVKIAPFVLGWLYKPKNEKDAITVKKARIAKPKI